MLYAVKFYFCSKNNWIGSDSPLRHFSFKRTSDVTTKSWNKLGPTERGGGYYSYPMSYQFMEKYLCLNLDAAWFYKFTVTLQFISISWSQLRGVSITRFDRRFQGQNWQQPPQDTTFSGRNLSYKTQPYGRLTPENCPDFKRFGVSLVKNHQWSLKSYFHWTSVS